MPSENLYRWSGGQITPNHHYHTPQFYTAALNSKPYAQAAAFSAIENADLNRRHCTTGRSDIKPSEEILSCSTSGRPPSARSIPHTLHALVVHLRHVEADRLKVLHAPNPRPKKVESLRPKSSLQLGISRQTRPGQPLTNMPTLLPQQGCKGKL